MLFFVVSCFFLSGCNKDDDDKVKETSIVGTWKYSDTDEDDYTITETYVFNANLTGSCSFQRLNPQGKVTNATDRSFEYALLPANSDGDLYIQVIYDDEEMGNRSFRYVITATKLLLYGSSYTEYIRQ